MSFRSILQDVRDGIGSISRRSFDVKFSYSLRSRSHSAVHDSHYRNEVLMPQSCWANMPPELLRDVISRIEASEGAWPARKHVVACSGVCRSWRAITKEIVKTPQLSGKLTFPISLRQEMLLATVKNDIVGFESLKEAYEEVVRFSQATLTGIQFGLISSRETLPEYQIIEVAENICNLKEEEGRRIYKRRDYREVSAENICNLKEEEGRRIYKRRDYREVSKVQKDSLLYKQLF